MEKLMLKPWGKRRLSTCVCWGRQGKGLGQERELLSRKKKTA